MVTQVQCICVVTQLTVNVVVTYKEIMMVTHLVMAVCGSQKQKQPQN
jgi:hypothetical protein